MRALIAIVVAAGCTKPAPPAAAPPVANEEPAPPAPALTDHEAIVRAVLERYQADPKTLPDAGLVRDPAAIAIVVDPVDVTLAPAVALPANPGRPFVLRRRAELQAEADRTGQQVGFVRIDIELDGDTATVVSGGDFVLPARSDAIKMCCCVGFDEYARTPAGWRFVGRTSTRCG